VSFGQWKRIWEGVTTPGTPVIALPIGDRFQVFISDPAGGVYTTRGSRWSGWSPWRSVSEGATKPGTPVTAVPDGEHFQVFVSDPAGGVYTARGNDSAGWSPWRSISEGATKPGTPVTAVRDGEHFQVFVSDPVGGVYTARGNHSAGWSPWRSISEGATKPGTPVAAVFDGQRFHVFVSDPAGGVYRARGNDTAGWGPWESLGFRTAPGTPVFAASTHNLFLSDSAGRIYEATLEQVGWLWGDVSEGVAIPGTPVRALALDNGHYRLFVADPAGGVYAAAGSHWDGWSQWQSVAEGRTKPGTQIGAARDSDGFFAVFVSDPAGSIYTTTDRQTPAAPRNLRVTSIGSDSIDLAWADVSDNEDGFQISYHGRRDGQADDEGKRRVDANTTRATLYERLPGHEYTITVAAYNAAGSSAQSNAVRATPRDVPHDVDIHLKRQIIIEGPIPFLGSYPEFGSVQPGRLLSISAPPSTQIHAVRIIKVGHSSEETNDNPDSFVEIAQGQTTTPAKMQQIFGVSEPQYSTEHPIPIIAVIAASVLLDSVPITLRVVTE
jgi:hypothetical protein